MNLKSWRIIALIFAILFTLSILIQIPALIGVVVKIVMLFNGELNPDHTGYLLGQILYWMLHFLITISLWRYYRSKRPSRAKPITKPIKE